MRKEFPVLTCFLLLFAAPYLAGAQTAKVPNWALDGEPMHQFGAPIHLHIDGPFYVGIGFCSHLPDIVNTGVLSNVLVANTSGKVR